MEYYTYILQSEKDHRFYKGQTQNLKKRLEYHNSGKAKYTKNYCPWKLFAYKVCDSRSEAVKMERMLKNLHSKEKLMYFLNRHNFTFVNERGISY